MKVPRHFFKRFGRPIIVGGLVGFCCALFAVAGTLHSWSDRLEDRLFTTRAPDPRIVIVAIDDVSISRIGRWPWDRSVHANLIRKLTDAGASVIAYDVNFSETQNAAEDADLAAAIQLSKKVILPSELRISQMDGHLIADSNSIISPLPIFNQAAIGTGFSNTPPDSDGVVRFMPLSVMTGGERTVLYPFSLEAAQALDVSMSFAQAPLDGLGRIRISYPGAPNLVYPTFSVADVLDGHIDPGQLKGKLVFVGSTAPDLHDQQFVPTSFSVPMSGVEIHAAFADMLLQNHWIRVVPPWVLFILFIVIGLLIGWIVSGMRERWALMLIIILWIGSMVVAAVLFEFGVLINILWISLTVFLSLVGVTIERRVASEKEQRLLRQTFEHYVSPSVVDTIMRDSSKLKLGGERRSMTILFSDVRSFTAMTETMKAETLIGMLNIFFNRMTDEIFRQNGVLDKYMGDGILAFWNAPFNQPDHPLLAVESALAMQKVLEQLNRAGTFGNPPWRMGIGINTGEVIVGNIGGESHADYTVIGDPVNLASRLEGLTREYQVWIIVSEQTAKALDGHVLLRRIDRVIVKGRFQTVTIYEVICELSKATAAQKELVRIYEIMWDLYCQRNFDEVIYQCQQILTKYPSDGPTLVMYARAREFLAHAPPLGWDGTWVFTEK